MEIKPEELKIISKLLQKGENVLLSYQKSKDELHIKVQKVEKVNISG